MGETSHHFDVVKPFDAVKTSGVRCVSRGVFGRKRRREVSEKDRAGRRGTGGRRAAFKHDTMRAGRHDDGSVVQKRTMNSGSYSQGIG